MANKPIEKRLALVIKPQDKKIEFCLN